jgi:formylglycine-generating enzyme required for sulfatase activity
MEFVTLQAGSMAFRIPDGQVMVYVPSGAFLMGTNAADRSENSRPQHTVTLAAYWIDRTEVTNEQYRVCVEEGFCAPPGNRVYFDNPAYDNYPVTQVAYDDAAVYCLFIGTRTQQIIGLPTEAQWEKAAGWDPVNQTQRTYPWGNEPPTQDRMRYIESNISRPQAPVGSYPAGASAYGALDMAGNVWEWVADWFDPDYYRRTGISLDPLGPESGLYRVTRGGSWTREAHLAVTTVRNPVRPTIYSNEIGFRCAMNVDRPPAGSGIVLTPIELVQAYDTLIGEARGVAGNDGATLDEWVAALDELETVLLGVDHMRASILINDRLDRLESQANNGLVTPVLALRLELGLQWIGEQVTTEQTAPTQAVTPTASPTP